MVVESAPAVYRHCCSLRKVKPNTHILSLLEIGPQSVLAMTELDCSGTFLGANGVRALLDFVTVHQHISHINLARNGVDADCIQQLCDIIPSHQSLRSVNLAGNTLSTVSARTMWVLAKESRTITYLNLEETGISEEWTSRIEKCVKKNEEFFKVGFFPCGVPRPVYEWATSFICVVGSQQSAELVCNSIIPILNHHLASSRVRVTGIVILEHNQNFEDIDRKLQLCAETYNSGYPWLVTFVESLIIPPAVEFVLQKAVLDREVIEPPPLRNKLGEVRHKLYSQAPSSFVFRRVQEETPDVIDMLPNQYRSSQFVDKVKASRNANFFEVDMPDQLVLRLETDLVTAFETVFRQPQQETVEYCEVDNVVANRTWAYISRNAASGDCGAFQTTTKQLEQYVIRESIPMAFPLVMYGAPGIGKHIIVSSLCHTLKSVHGSSMKVVPYFLNVAPKSLVSFLWAVLDVFQPGLATLLPSMESMLKLVHDAILNYDPKALPITLVVHDAHLLNARQRSIHLLGWLPESLPPNVRIILSIATESPMLVTLRRRQPQPYEQLASPAPSHLRMQALLKALQKKGVAIHGITPNVCTSEFLNRDLGVISSPNDSAHALLLKEEADLWVYIQVVAELLVIEQVDQFESESEVRDFIIHSVPETCEATVARIISHLLGIFDENAVQLLLAVVAVAPVTVSDLTQVCEEMLGAPRFSVIPALIALCNSSILEIGNDGVVRFIHTKIEKGAQSCCSVQSVEPMLAVHLRQSAVFRTPSMCEAFKVYPDLLVRNGQVDLLYEDLMNANFLDDMLQNGKGMRVWIVDALVRLLGHLATLEELGEESVHHLQFVHSGKRRSLVQTLEDFCVCPPNIYQAALLMPRDRQLAKSARAAVAPYPSLIAINNNRTERTSTVQIQLPGLSRHCNLSGKFFAVSEGENVRIFDLKGATVSDAEKIVPDLLGAIVAGDIVMCVGKKQLVLWNFQTGVRQVLDNCTCSLNVRVLNSSATLAVVVDTESLAVSLLDIGRGKLLSTLPARTIVREAQFSGEGVAIVSVYDVILSLPGPVEHVMKHEEVVRDVCSTADGTFIATCAGKTVYMWSNTGDCVHVCHEHSTAVQSLTFHPNGSLLCSTDVDGNIILWVTISGQSLCVLKTYFGPCHYCCFTPDGTKLLGRCGQRLRMWDGTTFQDLGAVYAHNGFVTHLSVSNSHAVSVCTLGEVKVWSMNVEFPSLMMSEDKRITRNTLVSSTVSPNDPVIEVTMNKSRSVLGVLGQSHTLTVWPLGPGAPLFSIENVQAVLAPKCAPGLFVLLSRMRIVVVRADDGSEVMSKTLPRDVDPDCTWKLTERAKTDELACFAQSRCGVRIFSFKIMKEELKILAQMVGHAAPLASAFFTHDLLVTASFDNTLATWSTNTYGQRDAIMLGTEVTAASSFGLGGAVCDANNQLHIVRFASSGEIVRDIQTYNIGNVGIHCVEFAPSLLLVVLRGEQGGMLIFDEGSGSVVNRISLYSVTCLMYAPPVLSKEESWVVCGTERGDVELFSVHLPHPHTQ